MKTMETHPRSPLFAGGLAAPAESLGRRFAKAAVRAGNWLRRRQIRGVDAHVSRADDLFAALDGWAWKQRIRETEEWLAQSQDVFELERRIRQLERGTSRHNW